MASFISGLIKGGIVAGAVLGAASVLLPARPQMAPVTKSGDQNLDAAPETTIPSPPIVASAPPAEPALSEPAAPEPAAPATPTEDVPDPMTPEPVVPAAPIPAPAAPDLAPEALLDPQPLPTPEIPVDPPVVAASEPAVTDMPANEPAPADVLATPEPVVTSPPTLEPVAPAEMSAPPTPIETFAPPLEKFAADFVDTGIKPLFTIILRDTGAADVDRAALAALPIPVTFAIDPEFANATEAMSIYRAAGKEVVMLVAGLPLRVTAQDLEQSFQIYDAILPETTAIMGPAIGGFQDNAVSAQLIVPVIAAQGRGMITFDRGLNSAAQVATREGLAQGQVFRQIDGNGESVPVIRRYLDRAVFKAVQDGSAIVMGETQPNTIEALAVWAIEGRASDVTVAPASAVLK